MSRQKVLCRDKVWYLRGLLGRDRALHLTTVPRARQSLCRGDSGPGMGDMTQCAWPSVLRRVAGRPWPRDKARVATKRVQRQSAHGDNIVHAGVRRVMHCLTVHGDNVSSCRDRASLSRQDCPVAHCTVLCTVCATVH